MQCHCTCLMSTEPVAASMLDSSIWNLIVKWSDVSISIFNFCLSWRCNISGCLYYRYVLLTRFEGEACTWCLTSAGLSFSILAAACSGFSRRSVQCMSLSMHACTASAPCSPEVSHLFIIQQHYVLQASHTPVMCSCLAPLCGWLHLAFL